MLHTVCHIHRCMSHTQMSHTQTFTFCLGLFLIIGHFQEFPFQIESSNATLTKSDIPRICPNPESYRRIVQYCLRRSLGSGVKRVYSIFCISVNSFTDISRVNILSMKNRFFLIILNGIRQSMKMGYIG